ncbi:class II D-tagatose-bisphosphate aldolase, non-catalytic subunit [Candidatus Bipolaricaulota bacterium]|nr:class II D-tagatose-bisphosphate aldolase, non-catalytic subunit [Candidatus Bipolaricaulota bacterium]
MNLKTILTTGQNEITLLGVCPMSDEIVKAAILEARDTGFIPMFIATPRQVDGLRGYTGWSQEELIDFIETTADTVSYEGDYLVARDHGGPYQSFRDRDKPEVPLSTAMDYALELYQEDLRGGFDVLHVDATEDPRSEGVLALEEIVRRTTDLISSIEEFRVEQGLPKVFYEVGTEEIVGGMTDPESFQTFIELLEDELKDLKHDVLEDSLVFVVGQVGTTMNLNMENKFDYQQAEHLTGIAFDYDLFLKVHYTDWLSDSTLEKFPDIGIGAANVGPEFATASIRALVELEREEKEALAELGKEKEKSNFFEKLETAAVEGAPWAKFAPDDLKEEDLDEYGKANRENIALSVGRYVLNEPAVERARKNLYGNLREYVNIDKIEQKLVKKIRTSIHRYVETFNLTGLQDR